MSFEREKYKQLGFNDYFIEHLREHKADHVLGYRCEPPYYVYSSPLAGRDIFPLWECGTTTVYYNRKSQSFEVCSLEDINDVWESYTSIQGVLAYLLLQLWEDEHTDEEIEGIAEAIGFIYTEKLLAEAKTTSDYSTWREQFPRQCS